MTSTFYDCFEMKHPAFFVLTTFCKLLVYLCISSPWLPKLLSTLFTFFQAEKVPVKLYIETCHPQVCLGQNSWTVTSFIQIFFTSNHYFNKKHFNETSHDNVKLMRALHQASFDSLQAGCM